MKDQRPKFIFSIREILIFILFLAIPTGVFPDTVQLKSGQIHSGKIINQNRRSVHLRTANGQKLVFHKSLIKRVIYSNKTDNESERQKPGQEQNRIEKAKQRQEQHKREQRRKELEQQRQKDKETQQKNESNQSQKPAGGSTVDLSALWRSALLPGWGQYYRNKHMKATGFWAGGLALVGASTLLGARYDTLSSSYDDAVIRDSLLIGAFAAVPPSADAGLFYLLSYADTASTRSQMQTVAGQHRMVTAAGLLFYAYNLIDACCIGGGTAQSTASQMQNTKPGVSYNVSILPERPNNIQRYAQQPTGSHLQMTLELRL